jgi:hypothetical protein
MSRRAAGLPRPPRSWFRRCSDDSCCIPHWEGARDKRVGFPPQGYPGDEPGLWEAIFASARHDVLALNAGKAWAAQMGT